jgi:hypothetical protein
VPKTCQQLGKNCGTVDDGCGGKVQCGSCVAPEVCGGGGDNVCGTVCKPRVHCRPGMCGTIDDDGCGESLCCGGAHCCI